MVTKTQRSTYKLSLQSFQVQVQIQVSLNNIRPISLLISFSKIFEKIIYNRINTHITLNNILTNNQFGFRNNLSTDNATFALLHKILSALDEKHTVGGIFCDLNKAFDCVNHKILLSKLEFYGIMDTSRSLIASYLSERYHRVVIKDKMNTAYFSNWKLVRHGVPQGLILGPSLFYYTLTIFQRFYHIMLTC